MKIRISTYRGFNIYYIDASIGCIFLMYASLLLLAVSGSTVWLIPYGWLIKFIGLYIRCRCILLLDSDGIFVVYCWFIVDLMERLVLYVMIVKYL